MFYVSPTVVRRSKGLAARGDTAGAVEVDDHLACMYGAASYCRRRTVLASAIHVHQVQDEEEEEQQQQTAAQIQICSYDGVDERPTKISLN